jgi:urea transport system ATP-binding protein
VLTVENLNVRYGGVAAVQGVSLEVSKGEVVGIVGPNGAGKTTTLSAILGLVTPSAGSIVFDGRSLIGKAPEDVAREGLALVPEGRRIFGTLTVGENLQLGSTVRSRNEDTKHDLERVLDRFPALKSSYSTAADRLSGGQQQQLAIARALVARPRLLILDEPTEGIQPSIIKEIGRVIERLAGRGDMAILLVEQYFEFARDLAQAYVVMQRGEVVLSGRQSEMDETAVRAYLTV